jgi:hypothetical protein
MKRVLLKSNVLMLLVEVEATPSAPSAPKTDERSASIIRQVALKSAVEYACAAKHDVNTILANAETFNAWMTGQSAAPASHTEHFANRNDPF